MRYRHSSRLITWLRPNWFSPKPLRSVAILPFGVLNQDSKNDYLGLGLTHAVITRLGNTQLVVRPLATVSRFAEREPIQSGRDLGVDAVVEGSVQTVDNRVRVSVRLLRVRDGKALWTQDGSVRLQVRFNLCPRSESMRSAQSERPRRDTARAQRLETGQVRRLVELRLSLSAWLRLAERP